MRGVGGIVGGEPLAEHFVLVRPQGSLVDEATPLYLRSSKLNGPLVEEATPLYLHLNRTASDKSWTGEAKPPYHYFCSTDSNNNKFFVT